MRLPWIVGLAVFAQTAWAVDVPGSEDLPTLSRYPQAEIIDYSRETVAERLYPMGSLQRIGGRLRMNDQVVVGGELTGITYQLPRIHSGLEAFTLTRQALLEQDAELLYWCEARECGSSSLWANSVFGKAMLYGPEAGQGYLLARLAEEGRGADSLIALYAITRGNGRAYLQVERLQPDAPLGSVLPAPATLLRQLRETGELHLTRLPDEPGGEWLRVLQRAFQQEAHMRVSLSGAEATEWREALVALGIRAGRIEQDRSDEPGLHIRLLR
ncbi:DUF4892 domain-containing protein [Stutzerimonas tarimensis]|uniref:DUF4892 domain-containing protein n=1 Tax=Stutzerimonas tarimensis TaxID=1507735 RepID=A0ABV7T6V4_9GAMM